MSKYELEMVNCPLCNSSDHKIFIKNAKELYNNMDEYFNVCKCLKCNHHFTNPRPTKATISYFYPDAAGYYQPSAPQESEGFGHEVYKKILNSFYGYKLESRANILLAILAFILKRRNIAIGHMPAFKDGGKLLDIGCSYGNYLFKMKQLGWDVYGTEINDKAVKYAKESLGLQNVETLFFEGTAFPNDFFDVVNMNMVLEHVYDPNAIIQRVNRVLKRGGQVMISVPDISGFESTFYREYSYGLQVPEHLQHFSPKTIRLLLENNGFKVTKIIHQKFDRDFVASAGYMKNQLLNRILHNKLIRKVFVKPFVLLLSLLGKTSRMSIYAVKGP